MKKCLLSVCMVVMVFGMWSSEMCGQTIGRGGITPALVDKMRQSFKVDAATRTAMNAVAKNDIKNLALNREALIDSDHLFSHKIKTGEITNQKSSGRCWLFAGLNIMRPKIIEKHSLKDFDFSETYLFFWDKLEKANLFLEAVIQTRNKDFYDREVEWLMNNSLPDGGQWCFVVELINKYGAVPESAMPETNSSGNTGMMNRLITTKLHQDAILLRSLGEKGKSEADLRARKEEMLQEIYRMLAINLGIPPTEFEWRFETEDDSVSQAVTYTPVQFYRAVVGINLDEYLCLYSCPSRPFGKLYEIEYDRDMYDKSNLTFVNLDIQQLKDYALASVLEDEPVWFGCDVGQENYGDSGIMTPGIYDYSSLYGLDIHLTKAERILCRESVPTHAMVFTGVDTLNGAATKWLVENSWGDSKGKKGYWGMSNQWFDEYVFCVVVNKKYVPQQVLDMFKTTPTVLPPWDPMYSFMR